MEDKAPNPVKRRHRDPNDVKHDFDQAQRFGEIVKSLIHDFSYIHGSDAKAKKEIAQKAGVNVGWINHIVNGDRLQLKSSELNRLGVALNLSSQGLKQFRLAFTGASDESSNEVDDNEVLASQFEILEKIRLPCFIQDGYANVIGANGAIAELYNITEEQINSEKVRLAAYKDDQKPDLNKINKCAFNLLRIIFDNSLRFHGVVSGDFNNIAMHNVLFFRELTLPYRNKQKFKNIFSELENNFPQFIDIWKKACESKKDHFSTSLHYHYPDPDPKSKNKYLSYHTSSAISVSSSHGELSLTFYLPDDAYTAKAFSKLITKRHKLLRFARWKD